MTGSREAPDSPAPAAGRVVPLWIAGPAVIIWVALLVLLLQIMPYPDLTSAQRIDAASLCLLDLDDQAAGCVRQGHTPLPSALQADATTVARFQVDIVVADPTQIQAVLIPHATDAVQVRVDGSDLRPTRGPDDPIWHDWNKPIFVGIPALLLRPGTVAVEIELRREHPGRLALHPFYLGKADTLETQWQLRFAVSVGASRMNWAISVILSLASLALWRMSPQRSGFGWLALVGIAACLSGSEFAFPNVTPQYPAWRMLCLLLVNVLVYAAFRFLHAFFGDPSRIYLSLMRGVMAANLAYFGLAPLLFGTRSDAVFFAGIWVMSILTLIWLLTLPPRGGCRPAMTLFAIFSLSVALATTQWIDAFGPPGLVRMPLAPPALAILFAGLIWSILQRFDELRRQRDRLNASLREQVALKSAELEQSYAALAQQDRTRTILQERQRIMLDLHDGIGGQLVNTLAYMENSGNKDPVLQTAIEDALRDMGLMIDSLHVEHDIPVMLGMIRMRLEPLLMRHRASFDWDVGENTRMDDQSASDVLALMRIVQEAITNAVKHSGATVIMVSSGDRAIRVADNGSGFDVSHDNRSSTSDGGVGLRGMRQRAGDIGISLEIRSSARGTTVDMTW